MTKAVSNREICFIKAVLLFYFLLNFASHGLSCPPPIYNCTAAQGKYLYDKRLEGFSSKVAGFSGLQSMQNNLCTQQTGLQFVTVSLYI